MYQALVYQEKQRLAHIRLNRPRQSNALNEVLVVELKDAMRRAEISDSVSAIVLSAEGEDFCLGWDDSYLQQWLQYSMNQHLAESASFGDLLLGMYRSTKVIVGAVQGRTAGPGAALLAICDWVYAAENSEIAFDEVKFGHTPAMVLPFLLRKLTEQRTKEMVLGGESIGARRAFDFGLVNEVLPKEQLLETVLDRTRKLCLENPAAPLQLSKKMIADLQNMPLENAMRFATKMNAIARTTDVFHNGIIAKLNKEKPQW